MQNVQNAAEIQQKVINLVELYRTKVGKESQKVKELTAEYKEQYDREIDFAYSLHQQGVEGYVLDIDIPEDAIDDIRVNEQLLGYFYKKVAQENADEKVTEYFLAEKYDSSIFTEEEESFLANHFAEMVNYIISTPNNDLSVVDGNDRNDLYLLPDEVLRFIKERFTMLSGSKIYNPFTGFAQLPNLYKGCTFFCEESYLSYDRRWNEYCDKVRENEHIVEDKIDENKLYAWMKIALFANNLDVIVLEDNSIPKNYDAVISYIPYIPSHIPNNFQPRTGYEASDKDMLRKISQSYQNLAYGGKMVLILPTEYLWEKKVLTFGDKTSYGLELGSLWKQMIDDDSLVEIIQLPSVMGKSFHNEEHSIIFAEKGSNGKGVSFLDARFASIKSESTLFSQTLDLEQLHAVIEGEGTDAKTGLRKLVQVSLSQVDPTLLVPQVYVIEKPLESEKPVPLTKLSSLVTSRICDVKEDLPEDTPWIKSSDLSEGICGTLDISAIQTAGCPNNPEGWSYGNRKLSNFLMGKHAYPEKDIRISHYRNCKFIDGKSNAVLFKLSKNGINFAVIEATGKAIAISSDIHVLLPIANYDAISIAAMLKNPIVYRQLAAYEKYGLYGPSGYLKEILVPTDKRIINDERYRLLLEQKTLKKKDEELAAKKAEYINEVRMRKHDMSQYLFELKNIEDLMRYYIENRDTETDFCQHIEELLDNFQSSLVELSTLLDNLSKEEQFGNLELFNLDEYLSNLRDRYKADGFKVEYKRDELSIRRYNKKIYMDDAIADAILDAQIEAYNDELALENAMLDAQIEAHNDELALENAMLDAQIEAHNDELALEDAMLDAQIEAHNDELALEDAILDAQIEAYNDELTLEDAMLDAQIQAHKEEMATQDVIADIYDYTDIDPANNNIPQLLISPNDMQRLVSNIVDNARKHGFIDHNRNDYEIKVTLSIDSEKNMFVLDFQNNGNPLPDGMNKLRYGIKGEKAGKTAGTGVGGSYVKSFVEHYGGDYDVFMDNGWTVIRIFLPIK